MDEPHPTRVQKEDFHFITINKPIGDLARRASWDYEIMYGVDDNPLYHVLILKGETPSAEVSFYDNRPDRPITDTEAQAVAADLTRVIEQ